MTAQEIFDTIVNHLRVQNCKSEGSNGVCLYRGPNGTKCAAGCLISDDDYKSSMEDKSIRYLIESGRLLKFDDHVNLISELQGIHDNSSVSNWERRFEDVAREYSLKYNPPISESFV